jgi:hypothetical protein
LHAALKGPIIVIIDRVCINIAALWYRSRNGLVCIATGCGLDGPGIESRWEWDFPYLSRPALRPTQPHIQRAPGLPRVKAAGACHLPPTPSSAEVKERVELYTSTPPLGLRGLNRVNLTFTFRALWYITQCHLVYRYQGLEEPLQKPCSGQKNKHGGKGRCKSKKDGTGTGAMDDPTNRPRSHAFLWCCSVLFCSSFGSFNVHHLVLRSSQPQFLSTFAMYVALISRPWLVFVFWRQVIEYSETLVAVYRTAAVQVTRQVTFIGERNWDFRVITNVKLTDNCLWPVCRRCGACWWLLSNPWSCKAQRWLV